MAPRISASLPGTGGRIRTEPEDFEVDEIPAYGPEGEGDHVIARVEKRGISTFEMVRRLAAALGVDAADIGTAGLKDARAVTRQQVSLPPPVAPEALEALSIDGVRVLSAARHRHKLRTGHLRGNRFRIRLRELEVGGDEAADRAAAVLAELARPPGSPNWFGAQRFGNRGDNARLGRDVLTGRLRGKKRPRGRKLRLLLSSLQSELFNRTLAARIEAGRYREVVGGDILKRTDSGGVFASEDTAVEQGRLERGEIVQTGPMFGVKMMAPAPGSAAAELEDAILAASEIEPEMLSRFARLIPGTRRPIAVAIGEPRVKAIEGGDLEVGFTLPSGAYATAVLDEIMKSDPATRERE